MGRRRQPGRRLAAPWGRRNTGGTVRATGQGRGGPWQTLGPEPGTPWPGPGRACTGRPRPWSWPLLAWGEGWRAWLAQGGQIPTRAGGPLLRGALLAQTPRPLGRCGPAAWPGAPVPFLRFFESGHDTHVFTLTPSCSELITSAALLDYIPDFDSN